MRTFREHQPMIELWHKCHLLHNWHNLSVMLYYNNNQQIEELKKMTEEQIKELISTLKEINSNLSNLNLILINWNSRCKQSCTKKCETYTIWKVVIALLKLFKVIKLVFRFYV